jgi:hypothetical protein
VRRAALLAFALLVSPGAAAASAAEAENPHESVISEQYREAEATLVEAAAPAPEPQYQVPEEQYHSETPVDVTVTQNDPQNVNVSIRIFSPGDNGAVVQTNEAAATVEQTVELVQPAKPAAPDPAPQVETVQPTSPQEPARPATPEPSPRLEPPSRPEEPQAPDTSQLVADALEGAPDVSVPDVSVPDVSVPELSSPGSPGDGIPDDWVWEWTSACFGGGPSAAPSIPVMGSGWEWRWSCEEDDEVAPPRIGSPVLDWPDPTGPEDELLPPGVADGRWPGDDGAAVDRPSPGGATSGDRPRSDGANRPSSGGARDRAVRHRSRTLVAPALQPAPLRLLGPAPAAAGTTEVAARLASFAPTPERTAAKPAARARAGKGRGNPSSPSPLGAGGLAAGPAGGLGTATSLLLGLWLAVLAGALLIIVPRLRRRRWSGPTRRPPAPPPARRERPG